MKPCRHCGIDFPKRSNHSMKVWLEGVPYCSRGCYSAARKGKDPESLRSGRLGRTPWNKGTPWPEMSGENNPRYDRTRLTCAWCGSGFDVPAYRVLAGAKFCKTMCAYAYRDKGLTARNERDRKSVAYKEWRLAVFQRDDHTCQICKKRGGTLHADHIKPFAYFPELRFDIANGRTLCVPCHKGTDTYGVNAWRSAQRQLVET